MPAMQEVAAAAPATTGIWSAPPSKLVAAVPATLVEQLSSQETAIAPEEMSREQALKTLGLNVTPLATASTCSRGS